MGVQLTELLTRKEISLDQINGRIIAVDSSLWLYQFLSTIRQRDGTLLTDSKGNVTSHISGLFSRTTKLMQQGVKLAFVFDGRPPELKRATQQARKELKLQAQKNYLKAKEQKDLAEMKKFAQRTSRLTKGMIDESKELIKALGLPVIQAPSEAEAQASYIVKQGKAFAVSSQDADCLLFGAPLLIRNLSLLGKKKRINKLAYEKVEPELISLSENLNHLGIEKEQLIALAMLIGTDYNPGGIKGIGPKNAIKLVKQFGTDYDGLFEHVGWQKYFSYPWQDVFYTITKIPITDDFRLDFSRVDKDKLREILIDKHEFSEERINNTLDKIDSEDKKQKGLGDFF